MRSSGDMAAWALAFFLRWRLRCRPNGRCCLEGAALGRMPCNLWEGATAVDERTWLGLHLISMMGHLELLVTE